MVLILNLQLSLANIPQFWYIQSWSLHCKLDSTFAALYSGLSGPPWMGSRPVTYGLTSGSGTFSEATSAEALFSRTNLPCYRQEPSTVGPFLQRTLYIAAVRRTKLISNRAAAYGRYSCCLPIGLCLPPAVFLDKQHFPHTFLFSLTINLNKNSEQ